MDLQLTGKKALITGSTLGIGYAIAERLAGEGAELVVNGRNQDNVDKAIQRIKSASPHAQVSGIAADLSTADGTQLVVDAHPNVDILVNNVGIFKPVAFEDISDGDWEHFFQINVMSGVRLSRAYLPHMREQNWGRLIFISSESGLQIPAEMVHYGTTKAAQIAVARGLAESLKDTGITANSVLPGPTITEGVEVFIESLAEQQGLSVEDMEVKFFKEERGTSLLQRFIKPGEIADMVAFLSSPLAAAVTGSAIRVDGGIIRSMS